MRRRSPFPPLVIAGFACGIAALLFFFVRPEISVVVLSGFVAACLAAPFFPQAGLFFPVTSHGSRDGKDVAITFDDGPHPLTTPHLLKLLARRKIRATFFVVGRNAAQHPGLVKDILEAGHCVGNHTFGHDVFVMMKPGKKLAREIDAAQRILEGFGIRPLAFRPPAGVVNPGLGPLLAEREMTCIHYSCRGPDMGNRRIRGLAGRILRKIRPGDILLLHDSCPDARHFNTGQWLGEIERILDGISEKGLRVVPLSELIGRPVMVEK